MFFILICNLWVWGKSAMVLYLIMMFLVYLPAILSWGCANWQIFTTENLTYYYPEQETPALKKYQFIYRTGRVYPLTRALLGCGKSSLIRSFNGLIPDFYGGRFGGNLYFQGEKYPWQRREKEASAPGRYRPFRIQKSSW